MLAWFEIESRHDSTGDQFYDEAQWESYRRLGQHAAAELRAVIGASDKTAAHPSDSPVTPEDVAATIYTRLGIDPTTELRDGQDKLVAEIHGYRLHSVVCCGSREVNCARIDSKNGVAVARSPSPSTSSNSGLSCAA